MANEMRIGGTIDVQVAGAPLSAAGEFTIDVIGLERSTLIGTSGRAGYKEEVKPCFIEGEIYVTSETDIEALHSQTNTTCQVNGANGKRYILFNAWSCTSPEIATSEGKVKIRFEGMKGKII